MSLSRLASSLLHSSRVSLMLEELKFLKSPRDASILYGKIAYVMPRLLGGTKTYSEVPPSLQMEPTNYCNISCTCCSAARTPRPRGYMEMNLFRRIIDQASDTGVKHIHLYLHGEPLLHPELDKMIGYIKKKGMWVHLTTNGMLFTREKADAMLSQGMDCGDHIMFSVLGISKGVHEAIMKGVKTEKVEENIRGLLELREKRKLNGPIVETIFYTMPENQSEAGRFAAHWRHKVDHARVVGKVSSSFSEYRKEGSPIPSRTRPCWNLWERLTVYWNGEVCLCCGDVGGEFIIGDLRKQSIPEIWNSEKFLAIKKIHEEGRFVEFPFCDKCDM
jgi:radical SAM protein with 4Fe4S-binding SPASM domain